MRDKGFRFLNAFTEVPREILGWQTVGTGRIWLIAQTEIKHFLVLS